MNRRHHSPWIDRVAGAFLILICSISGSLAGQIRQFSEVGVNLTVPEDWKLDDGDTFGQVLLPQSQSQKKIRIHLTGCKNVSPAEAVCLGAETVREHRERLKLVPEAVLSSQPITTKHGFHGQRAEIGVKASDAPSYLTKCYFEGPHQRIFCICIYHYGDERFAQDALDMVTDTMTAIE